MERDKILNAFPTTLKQGVEKVIEILPLNDHNVLLVDGQIHKVDNLIHPNEQVIFLDKEVLKNSIQTLFQ